MKKLILSSLITASFTATSGTETSSVIAPSDRDHYWTVGKTTITAELDGFDSDVEGFGVNWIVFSDQEDQFGHGVTFDFATTDEGSNSYADVQESLFTVGYQLGFRPWKYLVIAPSIGLAGYAVDIETRYGADSASETGIAFGLGAHFEIPKTNILINAHVKQINMGGDLSDYDIASAFIGIGYKF